MDQAKPIINTSTARVLFFEYQDKSATKIIRVYLEPDFDQAIKDRDMLADFGSDDKNYRFQDVEIFNPNKSPSP